MIPGVREEARWKIRKVQKKVGETENENKKTGRRKGEGKRESEKVDIINK
jgi:hypothetical protein